MARRRLPTLPSTACRSPPFACPGIARRRAIQPPPREHLVGIDAVTPGDDRHLNPGLWFHPATANLALWMRPATASATAPAVRPAASIAAPSSRQSSALNGAPEPDVPPDPCVPPSVAVASAATVQ